MPSDVNFTWVKEVGDDFHARFDAYARAYEFKILNHPVRSALKADSHLWEPRPLDVNKMQEGANLLLGEHDFSCFRDSLCQAKSPVKTIEYLNLQKDGDTVLLEIKANAFLHHMVRNIVGTLLKVGRGERDINWVQTVLDSRDRRKAGPTAEPQGLYFVKAFYKTL